MLVFQTSVGGESSGSVSKCKLFSQAILGCNLNGLMSGENLIILMFGRYLYKGRTIRKVMGGEGNFRAAGIFFRYQIPCMNFFQALA